MDVLKQKVQEIFILKQMDFVFSQHIKLQEMAILGFAFVPRTIVTVPLIVYIV